MDGSIPGTLGSLLATFAPVFSSPSHSNFVAVLTGWMLCVGRHTVSRVIRASCGPARRKHHSTLYRFLARASWYTDELGHVLFGLILPRIPGWMIHVITDDTLCRKSGPHIWGAGMHHDPLASSYGRGSKAGRHVAFAFGHNWVVLALWVPYPWNRERGCALPILWRLYRAKKRCAPGEYRKRTDLAADLLQILAAWVPADRRVIVVGDTEYACRTLLRRLPRGLQFIGPLPMNAALYAPAPERSGRRGRPRRHGERLPTPQQTAQGSGLPWETKELRLYGRQVRVRIKTWTCLWYRAWGSRIVRVVLTRDPKGRIEDRAYFTTDETMTADQLIEGFSRRWSLEVTFRDCKQHLGLEDPQNGWWRRLAGSPRPRKIAGPQPRSHRGEPAVRRTVPIAFTAYTVVVSWYFQHGSRQSDVREVRVRAPWYRHKKRPSFGDMLRALRRELWRARFSEHPRLRLACKEIQEELSDWLLAA